jgi:hypothetical protein
LPGTEVRLQDAASRVYTLNTGAGGCTARRCPNTSETASAYGFKQHTGGILVSPVIDGTGYRPAGLAPAATGTVVALDAEEAGDMAPRL